MSAEQDMYISIVNINKERLYIFLTFSHSSLIKSKLDISLFDVSIESIIPKTFMMPLLVSERNQIITIIY
jgi:hypothetical protein